MMEYAVLAVVVFSSLGAAIHLFLAEVDLVKNGVPSGRRLFSINGLRVVKRIVFYFGEHEKLPVAHKAIGRARVFALTFFASCLILVVLRLM